MTYLLCLWANSAASFLGSVILADGAGGYWKLVVDTDGNLGTESNPGPASPVPILADGGGGFWALVADTDGNRGADTSAGPATAVPVLIDGMGVSWKLVVDTDGNVGTSLVI